MQKRDIPVNIVQPRSNHQSRFGLRLSKSHLKSLYKLRLLKLLHIELLLALLWLLLKSS